MSRDKSELTEEELKAQNGEPLPDREVMSMVHPLPQPMPFDEAPSGGSMPQPDGGPTYIDPQPSTSDAQPTATDQQPQPVPIANQDPQPVPPAADPPEKGPEPA
jgi:hypothetical protein